MVCFRFRVYMRRKNRQNRIRGEYSRTVIRPVGSFDGCRQRAYFVCKNAETERPMASTTKIMTCILALERADPDESVSVSANAAAQPRVRLGTVEGQKFKLKDLLYSLMLESHNDTAVMLAEHLAGSVEQFADEMNQKARELGLSHTHFVTPNGLDGADDGGSHRTTAEELARIMRYCVMESPKRKEFLEITGVSSYQFSDLEQTQTYSCINHNAFLTMMEGAVSGKPDLPGRQDIATWGH